MASSMLFTLACALAFWSSQAADPFLQKHVEDNTTLVNALELIMGDGNFRDRVNRLQDRIRPLFMSLPKNTNNQLSHAAARYALHRVIVDMHGWSIEGLEPNVSTYNTTSIVGSGALTGVVSAEVESVLSANIGTDGFTLHELAVLASTVEYGVHEQHQLILRRVCELYGLPTVGAMSKSKMRKIIQVYEAVFLVGAGNSDVDLKTFSASDADRLLASAGRRYPGWEDTLLFVDDEMETLAFNDRSVTNPFQSPESSLQLAIRIVEQAADHFGRHLAELECQEIKEDLLAFERADTGRILLADFYRAGLTGRFFYVETKEYLQALGALDDSDSLHGPKVIVSNYVQGKVNCLAHSNSYSVCCLNECDTLYTTLENATVGYESTPGRIASLVSAMSSSTVRAPRNLSQSLLSRLDEIAMTNRGSILLHSRLFAQWMHQAFPRECIYPHLIGSTTSMSPTAWSQQNGLQYRIDHVPGSRMQVLNESVDELDRKYAAMRADANAADEAADDVMWTLDEETFVMPTPSMSQRIVSTFSGVGCRIFGLLIVGLIVGGAISTKTNIMVGSDGCAKVESVFV